MITPIWFVTLSLFLLCHSWEQRAAGKFSSSITFGVNVNILPFARVYTDKAKANFLIPDLPEQKKLPRVECPSKTSEYCELLHESANTIEKTEKLLGIANNVFTFQGLDYQKPLYPINANQQWPEDLENLGVVTTIDKDWMSETRSILNSRSETTPLNFDTKKNRRSAQFDKNLLNSTAINHSISKKSVGNAILPVAKFLAPIIGPEIMNRLFVKDKALESTLGGLKAFLPKLINFNADIAPEISGYSVALKMITSLFTNNQNILNQNKNEPSTIKGSDKALLGLAHNSGRQGFVHSTIITNVVTSFGHLMSMAECRSNNIPLLFVPPSQLINKMIQMKPKLSHANLEFVLPAEEAQAYYSLKTAKCRFDDLGGIIEIGLYVKPKNSEFQVFEYQSTSFAWNGFTCDLGISSGYIIRDVLTGNIHPISQLEEETCEPKTKGLCKLPEAANADVYGHYCLSTILQTTMIDERKKACPLTCREGNRTTVSQEDPDSISIAHLPTENVYVHCDDGFKEEIHHNVKIGAIKFKLACGCKVFFGNILLGKSISKICDPSLPHYSIEHMVPIQMSRIDMFLPQLKQSELKIVVENIEDMIDPEWAPENRNLFKNENVPKSMFSFQIPVLSLILGFMQFISFVWLCFKLKIGWFAFLNPQGGVNAASIGYCGISQMEMYLHFAELALIMLVILPWSIRYLYKTCQNAAGDAIENRATIRLKENSLAQSAQNN